LYRHDEAHLDVVEQGRPWSFDGDGYLFRLVSEAHRIRLAHLFDPVLAVHTSLIDPLPHQITAVYEAMLPRQPLRFLLADDPGAGKTIMAGLLIKELIVRGVEDRRVKLGCVMPGESPAVFGDALRRLAAAATYLYQDGPRYWYSTQPTVTKLAEDRAEQLKRDPDKVVHELDKRLRADLRKIGDFSRVHPLPGSSADVPDDLDARLVVLGVDHAYTREPGNAAGAAAKAILEARGGTPRLYRNALVFLAADKTRLQELDEAVRTYLAWESILAEKDTLDLSPHQVRQAETQKAAADSTMTARLPETYQWLLVPIQTSPQAAVVWQAIRLSGQEALAVRASKKLRTDELLITSFGATRAHGAGPRAAVAWGSRCHQTAR
jgi:hypothetical protein